MKKLFLFVALFTWIGFNASAQDQDSTKRDMWEDSDKMDHDSLMKQKMHYWYFKDGKVMEVKDGIKTHMTTETQVNGVWIRPNGQVVMMDDKVVTLKSNQYLDDKGKIHTKSRKKDEMK